MTTAIFGFIASVLLLLPVVFSAGDISVAYQLIVCTPFLLCLGIPHGAIDNVLYRQNNQIKNSEFISVYLVIIGLNILLWLLLPDLAYILFLCLSSYHFGQSQFNHYFVQQPLTHKLLFVAWGISILAGLVYFNIEQINIIITQQDEFSIFAAIHQETLTFNLFIISTITTLILMVVFVFQKTMTIEMLLMEILVLGLILMCFYLMPLLIGFTLYFVILHSYKVLREEYLYLNEENEIASIRKFVLLLAPYTLLSVAGILLLFGMIYLDVLTISYGYCLLIAISSITLPHVFVMNRFYNVLFSRNYTV